MRTTRGHGVARAAGGILGMALAAVVVLAARPAGDTAGLTATARFSVPPSAELAVTPGSPSQVLVADGLRPGGKRASASFEVHNQTAAAMRLTFRARPSSTALNGLLQLRLSSGRLLLTRAPLQGLLHGVSHALALPAGATRRLSLEAWIPSDAGDGYEGQLVRVALVPSASGAALR